MNTKEAFTKDGQMNPHSEVGKAAATQYYVYCRELPVVDPTEMDDDLFIPAVVAITNKYRLKLREEAMGVYGD